MSLTSVETKYEHIILDKKGVPIITGTNMKVIALVLEKSAYEWCPEELHFQHPYLTLGQIHSALAYYWDHQKELDADIIELDPLAEDYIANLYYVTDAIVESGK